MDYRIQQLRYQLREDPASRYFFQLGDLLRKQGELDEAAEILERGLEIHPRYVAAWVALGRTRQSAGDLVAAEEAYARALELDPEHGVAARLIGETALARGDEIRAVTAFKLARALLGPDADLEERIADLETRTLPGDAVETPFPASEVEPEAASEVDPNAITHVFEIDDPPAEEPEPFAVEPDPTPWRPRPGVADVVFLDDDDPFAVTPSGQTGVFVLGDDVFTSPESEPAPPVPDPAGYEGPDVEDAEAAQPVDDVWGDVPPTPAASFHEHAESEGLALEEDGEAFDAPPPFEVDEASSKPAEVVSVVDDDAADPTGEPIEAAPDDSAEAILIMQTDYPSLEVEVPPEAETPDDDATTGEVLPVPTLTLARLAWEQDDLPLAERTLEALLEKNPDDADAADFLELVRNRPRAPEMVAAAEVVVDESPAPAATAVAALQGWLHRFRLAAERSRP
jgi:tetratricopeptide (TPR) repeat protein